MSNSVINHVFLLRSSSCKQSEKFCVKRSCCRVLSTVVFLLIDSLLVSVQCWYEPLQHHYVSSVVLHNAFVEILGSQLLVGVVLLEVMKGVSEVGRVFEGGRYNCHLEVTSCDCTRASECWYCCTTFLVHSTPAHRESRARSTCCQLTDFDHITCSIWLNPLSAQVD